MLNPEHYAGLRKDAPRTKVVLVERFQTQFPDQALFLDRLLAQYAGNPVRHLRGILELASHYPPSAMLTAFQTACEYNTYSVGFLRGVLQHQAQPLTATPAPVGTLIEIPRVAIKRDLRVYQILLEPAGKGVAP